MADTRNKTSLVAALTVVLCGCLVALIASDDLTSGLRYSLGAAVTAAILVCAYRLGAALRTNR
ncbi:hypothetical protein [Actinoplanes sp. N902-109]|uniref:hypothetical protein n=1 Tax=Actinoplanes sp. (strain N902-109) TaxID=649831 RepID=UPI0003295A40|nr:hypothetical protein [Actinoplanes sp. N902-109]AGL13756.1 hypothetical protein L083_0246 [Actinoplanes sp. N902-109]